MAVISIAMMGVGMADISHEVYGGKPVRYTYYCTWALAWALSYKLTRFEFLRRLHMQWLGQRSFWPISFVINFVTSILEIIVVAQGERDNDLAFAWSKIAILLISSIFTLTLSIIAFKKPDDFYSLTSNDLLLGDANMM